MCNKTLVIERVKECFTIAAKRWPGETFRMPNIRFDKRGTTAGTANGRKWELNFNMTLLNENVDDFIKQTVAHEVAHLLDYQVYDSHAPRYDNRGRRKRRQPHGTNWKRCMTVLGVSADRCHDYDVSNAQVCRRKTKKYEYECTCGCGTRATMGAIRHNKQQSGKANYRLNGHGGAPIKFIRQI